MKCLVATCMLLLLAAVIMAQESPIVEKLEAADAWINWERQVIKAVGVGVLPGDAPNHEEAERLARQAAGVNAYRNLESAIRMARVHDETLVGNIIPEVPEIRLKQLAHSAQVVSDRQIYDRSFEVILQVPLAGVVNILAPIKPSDSPNTFVIDARGLDIAPALFPKILDTAGNEVYSRSAVYTINGGPEARGDTCAPVVKALEIRASTDIIVSNADAEKIKQGAARLIILVSPAREPDKPTPAP